MELEIDSLLNLSSISPEISLEAHEIFHPERKGETRTIIFMGRLSIANEKHNIRNIIWMRKVENWYFLVIGETEPPDWSWMMATQVTDTPFELASR